LLEYVAVGVPSIVHDELEEHLYGLLLLPSPELGTQVAVRVGVDWSGQVMVQGELVRILQEFSSTVADLRIVEGVEKLEAVPWLDDVKVALPNVPKVEQLKGDVDVPLPVHAVHDPVLLWVSLRVQLKFELDVPLGFVQVTVSVLTLVAGDLVPAVEPVGVPTPANAPKVEHL